MLTSFKSRWESHSGGIFLACVIAASATFLSEHYGAPVMLFALLIGMAFNFLSTHESCAKGIEFSAKTLLRFGVGLLGLRLSIGDVESIGFTAVAAVLSASSLAFAASASASTFASAASFSALSLASSRSTTSWAFAIGEA